MSRRHSFVKTHRLRTALHTFHGSSAEGPPSIPLPHRRHRSPQREQPTGSEKLSDLPTVTGQRAAQLGSEPRLRIRGEAQREASSGGAGGGRTEVLSGPGVLGVGSAGGRGSKELRPSHHLISISSCEQPGVWGGGSGQGTGQEGPQLLALSLAEEHWEGQLGQMTPHPYPATTGE